MAVTLPESVLTSYARFSLYNSPYRAHDEGRAIDLYPESPRDGRTTAAPCPVDGVVRETRTVRAPPKPYAPVDDHLLLLECTGPDDLAGLTVRILHVEPTVAPGDRVARGDSLGTLVRAGFFAPWVDNHLHVGLRPPDRDPYRASGSLRLEPAVDVAPLAWDGTGTVVATGETYAVLDAPAHPDPESGFVGVAADGSEPSEVGRSPSERGSDAGGVLDGGLPHYACGGVLGAGSAAGPVSLNGDRLGAADGRTVAWGDVVVTANGDPVTGLSLCCARDADFGAKLICPERSFAVGDRVAVRVRSRGSRP